MRELDDVMHAADARNLMIAYLRVYHGADLVGRYDRVKRQTRLNTYSVGKSVTSIAAGIAMDEGLFTLDDRVCRFFPDYDSLWSPRTRDIRVRHLLTMTSGLANRSFLFDDPERYVVGDWMAAYLTGDFAGDPGVRFHYNNLDPYVLGRIIERTSHSRLVDYLRPRLFDPLGIGNPDWLACPRGHAMAASGLLLTADEMVRFGLLLLGGGMFHGRRLVSEAFVERATHDESGAVHDGAGDGYGYYFWIDDDLGAYRAEGRYGQFIVVLPAEGFVIVCQAFDDGDVYRLLRDELILPLKNHLKNHVGKDGQKP